MTGNRLFVFILVGLTACRTSRQAAPLPTQTVTIRDTITVPVPQWRDTGSVTILPVGNLDSFFIQMEKSWATVKMTQDTTPTGTARRRYRVEVGAKPDTIFVPVTLRDTIRIECPDLPPVPEQGHKFPWQLLGALVGALLVWWVGKKRSDSE